MASLLTMKHASIIYLLPSSRCHNLAILSPLFHFSTQTQRKEGLPFIAKYLISSFDFPKDRAIRVAADKNLGPIKNQDRPESVIRFLKGIGFTDFQSKNIICLSPYLLAKNVSKTLEPCYREVIDSGFPKKIFIKLIERNPMILAYKNLQTRLRFWRNFVGNDDEDLLRLFKHRMLHAGLNIEEKVIPRINLLKEYGCSEKEVRKIFLTYPTILGVSEEKLKQKINFLVEKAELKAECIFCHSYLLTVNLEKKLIPRLYVFRLLKSKGLLEGYDFYAFGSTCEMDFVNRFIKTNEMHIPGLAKLYSDARAGKMQVKPLIGDSI